jgi:hypothetical protein
MMPLINREEFIPSLQRTALGRDEARVLRAGLSFGAGRALNRQCAAVERDRWAAVVSGVFPRCQRAAS